MANESLRGVHSYKGFPRVSLQFSSLMKENEPASIWEKNDNNVKDVRRSISVEPLIEHIKDVFKIDPLPIRGYQKAAGITLLSVLLYQIIVYYNCKAHKEHPKAIKNMLGIHVNCF